MTTYKIAFLKLYIKLLRLRDQNGALLAGDKDAIRANLAQQREVESKMRQISIIATMEIDAAIDNLFD